MKLFFLCALITSAHLTSLITHSTVPLLNDLKSIYLEKYPETYKQKVEKALQSSSDAIRVVTYNILFDVLDANLKDQKYSWKNRLPKVIESIENMDPDILCVQELYPTQLEDLKQVLEDRFDFFVGDSSIGELNGIFYKKNRFTIEPNSCSLELPINPKDDARVKAIPNLLPLELEPGRMLTLAHFQDKITGKAFTVINTHLSFFRINSRNDQAHFIRHLVSDLHTQNKSVIVTGDLNTFPNHPDKRVLPFYDGDHICQILQQELKDTKDIALLGHFGPQTTGFHDFLKRNNKPFIATEDSDVILDHIFVSPTLTTLVHATEPCQSDGAFPSDHMPVIADILLP